MALSKHARAVAVALAIAPCLVAAPEAYAQGAADQEPASAAAPAPAPAPDPALPAPAPVDPPPGPVAVDILGAPPPEDRPSPRWIPPYRPESDLADLVVIGAGVAMSIGGSIASPYPKHTRGGVLFDEDVRDALRVRSQNARYQVRDASDVGLSLEATWPFLVDALITAWWYRGNEDIARRMALVDAEAFAIVGGIHGVTNNVASRERPYGRECGDSIPDRSVDCERNVRYRSFFSGHAAISFTGAGLICAHHLGLGLLGPPGDALSCAGAYAVAATTATFRVMADMHYATDVLTGALVGTAFGIGIPLLRRTRVEPEPRPRSVRLQLIPVGAGVGVGGAF